jgi:O-antigen/teichoic acid export membrane protein
MALAGIKQSVTVTLTKFRNSDLTVAGAISRVGTGVAQLRQSRNVQRSLGNAGYSVLDYLAQPVLMVLAAPFLVHRLGLSQYGIWMVVSAVIGSVGMLSGGFGDAVVKYVSTYRGRKDDAGVVRTIRGTIAINGVLGGVFAAAIIATAPFAASQVFKVEPGLLRACIAALQIGGVILFVRSIESVFVSALRAFERYGPTVKLSLFTRSATILAALLLVWLGCGVKGIMVATLLVALCGAAGQAIAMRSTIGPVLLLPAFDKAVLSEIAAFGCFSWLQATAAVAFSHGDKLLVGAFLGTSAVAYYTLCVQAAQPVHGLVSAALNFLFPHISERYESGDTRGVKRAYRLSMLANFAVVVAICLPMMIFAQRILTIWMGREFAQHAHVLLVSLTAAFGLLAINIVPFYLLLGLGRVRLACVFNLTAGLMLMASLPLAVPHFGIAGAGICRLGYAALLAVPYIAASIMAVGQLGYERVSQGSLIHAISE